MAIITVVIVVIVYQ